MMRSRFRWLMAALAMGGVVCAGAPQAFGQAYPNRPIRLILMAPPGGPTDLLGRALAQKFSELLPEPVVAENRPGAAGIIAYGSVAKAPPDGYTLLLGDLGGLAVNPSLYKSLPYDTRKDFTPIGPVATAHLFLFANTSLPVRTLQELIALAKSKPGTLSFGSNGAGQFTHIGPELLKLRNGLDMLHVPYKGIGPAMVDAVAGRISFIMTTGLASAKPHIDSGKLRALAVTGEKRSAGMPEVPTFAESGSPLPELNLGNWWCLVGPANLPRPIVVKLSDTLAQTLAAPDVLARLAALNMAPLRNTPEGFAEMINAAIETWGQVLKRMNIKSAD